MCLTDGRRAEDFNRFQHYIWLYVVGLFVVGSSEYLYRRTGWGPQVVLPPFVGVDRLSSVTRCHIALHRVMAAAELPCDPLGTPAQRLQPHHRRHIVRRFHHLPPQNLVLLGASRDSSLVHSLSPQASEEGAIPRDAEGAIFHGARHARGWPRHAGVRESCTGADIRVQTMLFGGLLALDEDLLAVGGTNILGRMCGDDGSALAM